MRILHVVPTYLPAYRYGGPIESVHALNKHLVSKGAEVTVFTTAMDGPRDLDVPLNQAVNVDGVQVYYFAPGFPRAWFYSRRMAEALRSGARKFDLMHITSVFLAASALGARAARSAGRPYIISPRGSLMRAPLQKRSALKKKIYLRLAEEKNLAGAAAIHFTTPLEKEEYVSLGLPLRRALVISNGLDTSALPPGNPAEFRKKLNLRPEQKIILFLSRLSWKKGLDTLIEAFAGLKKEMPEAVLLIAGGDDEGYKSQVEAMLAKEGVKSGVIFTGELLGAEKSSAYEAASVFALPSYAENFGVVVAEAMHFGVPVVISDAVGIAPQVAAAEAGFVVRKDPLEVKFALFKILQNAKAAAAMGARGERLVAEKFSYDAVADRFLEAYGQMVYGIKARKLV